LSPAWVNLEELVGGDGLEAVLDAVVPRASRLQLRASHRGGGGYGTDLRGEGGSNSAGRAARNGSQHV